MNLNVDYKMIAQETMHIIDLGGYILNEQRVHLKLTEHEMTEAITYSPKKIVETKESIGQRWKRTSEEQFCQVRVINSDSYEAANKVLQEQKQKSLVMNFANAIYCGGGFLSGANAQEEALCRASTLYASISSESAKKMYEYNFMYENPMDSDYMIISPDVEVFRDGSGELIESFLTSVVTIPALNLRGRARKLDKDKVKHITKERIRNMFAVAYSLGYESLILGAWGCGVFGHDAKDVANYFREILEEEEQWKMFKTITFAVFDHSREQYNYKSFVDVFGLNKVYGNQEEAKKNSFLRKDQESVETQEKGMVLARVLPPVVNVHREVLKKGEDLKIAAGCTKDGRSFLAELYQSIEQQELNLIVILPAKGLRAEGITKVMDDSMTVERSQMPVMNAAIVQDLNVSSLDAISDSTAASEICDYLIDYELIQPIDDSFSFDYYISYDLAGEKVVVAIVTLQEGEKQYCDTKLEWIL